MRTGKAAGGRMAALALAIYSLLALAYTFPLCLHLQSGVLRGEDTEDALEQTWVIAWAQHAIDTRHLALFDAPIFHPTAGTLAYQDILVPVAALLLPLHWAGAGPLLVYNVGVLLAFPLTGLCMYLLALHLTGDHRAAFLAGLIFAFCPYRERHIEHLNQLSAEGVPLSILFFELARAKGAARHWLGLGLSLAASAMLSIYYLVFLLLGLGCYVLVLALRRLPILARGALRGSPALLPGLALLAVLALPYLHTQRTVGAERRLHDIVYFSGDVRDFLHTGAQSLLYGWSDGLWQIPPFDIRQYLFPGWTALILTALGVLWAGRRRSPASGGVALWAARPYALVAGILAVLTLGPYLRFFGFFTHVPLPYFIVYFFIPGYGGFRDIGRIDQVTMAFLAGAAALGAAGLLARMRPAAARRLTVAIAALLCLEYAVVQRPLLPVAGGGEVPAVYHWLAAQPAGVVAELPICDLPPSPCVEESYYMYYATTHWHPLVNGGGGFFPPGWDARTRTLDSFPSPGSTALLRSLGTRYLVVHPNFPNWGAVRSLLVRPQDMRALGLGAPIWQGPDLVFLIDPSSAGRTAAQILGQGPTRATGPQAPPSLVPSAAMERRR